jgi:hypothetical protein
MILSMFIYHDFYYVYILSFDVLIYIYYVLGNCNTIYLLEAKIQI